MGGNPQWKQITFEEVKELCKAAKSYGRDSAYFRGLLPDTFAANVFTPHDLWQIITSLLSPAEYSLWELAWKCALNQLLRDYAGNPAIAALMLEQLAGDGILQL